MSDKHNRVFIAKMMIASPFHVLYFCLGATATYLLL